MLPLAQLLKSPAQGVIQNFVPILYNVPDLCHPSYFILVTYFYFVCCFYSFIGRLFRHALEDLRPNSVLVNSLSVCISLLDPRRLTLGTYHMYSRQLNPGSTTSANPETIEGMLGSLGKGSSNIFSSSCSLTSFGLQDKLSNLYCPKFHQLFRCLVCNYFFQVILGHDRYYFPRF